MGLYSGTPSPTKITMLPTPRIMQQSEKLFLLKDGERFGSAAKKKDDSDDVEQGWFAHSLDYIKKMDKRNSVNFACARY